MVSELRLLILGLLAREPRSAYALGRALAEMPAGGFSGSPGAIYPAVRAMVKDGLLERVKSRSGATRGQPYVLTKTGDRILGEWLEGPIDGWDLIRSPGVILLKLSFLEGESAQRRLRRELGDAAEATLASLRAYRSTAALDLADSSEDAIRLTEALFRAYVEWAGPKMVPSEEMQPVLRPATPDDSELVFRVKKAALGEYIRRTWGWDERFQRDVHVRGYDPGAIKIISCLDMEVGWLEVDRRSDEFHLAGIYLLPGHQGHGVGSAVIMDIIEEASERQLPVTLQVLKVNPRAQALYERLGFVVTGETRTHRLMKRSQP